MDNFTFARVLAMHVEALSVVAEIEGIKAANTERERNGYALAYGEEAFTEKARLLSGIAMQMLEASRG